MDVGDLSDEHLMAVGRITVAAGRLEGRLHEMAEAVVHSDPNVVRVLLGAARFEAKLETVGKLVELKRPGGAWPLYKTWADAARAAMRERNKLLHGEWMVSFGDDGLVPAIYTRKRTGMSDDEVDLHATAEDLDATADRLEALAEQAETLFVDMVEWGGSYYVDDSGEWAPLWTRIKIDDEG
ncbi:hypothetical protein ACOACO_17535 [Nocardioides sp. CPCC 205120]|uniref:hypothetical protein n=1 Tax=Nocardioides sp. CPCC 205120 TaxID=3406462 RepID=UPI003B507C8D